MSEVPGTLPRPAAIFSRWIDAIVLACAFAVDAVTTMHVRSVANSGRIDLWLAAALAGSAAAVLFPRTHQRRLVLGVALLALPVIGALNPRVGLTGILLAAVLIVRCTFAYGLRGAGLAGAFAFVMFAIGVGWQLPPRTAIVALIAVMLLFGTLFAVVAFLTNSLRSESAARAELEEAHRRLRDYAERSAEMATLEERSRVALDLHDALGHGLTTLSVQLQSAARLRGSDNVRADEFLALANATATSLLTDLRETVGVLRRTPADLEPFSRRIEQLFTDFAATGVTDFRWTVTVAREPDDATAIVLQRVVQEALTNVARHAAARHLNVCVSGDDAAIAITIEDDGCGFMLENATLGNGLHSMRERITAAGGAVRIDSIPGRGTTVSVSCPLPRR